MAIYLCCHSTLDKADVEKVLQQPSTEHADLFSHKFLISKILDSGDVHKETARQFGLRSRFFFLIRVNDKSEAHRMREVAGVLRKAFGPQNVLVLFENDTEVGPEHQPS